MILSDEVTQALSNRKPVVALESTIISHGMPYPQNVQCAIEIEQTVRTKGATPATIAILDGQIHIGLSSSQLEQLGELGPRCAKCSRRDLPFVISKRENGATTVAATIWLAHKAGIHIMATGGIGGVHRGAETSMDISADLTELAQTPVLVVCAGIKSILDIPRTLEYLETKGVAVAAYQTEIFPAFFTRHSNCRAPHVIKSIKEAAQIWSTSQKIGNLAGMVLGVPIPAEHEANGDEVEKAIEQALFEASEQNIIGNYTTPFILKRIHEITEGRSLDANIQLVKHNASVAAQIGINLQLS